MSRSLHIFTFVCVFITHPSCNTANSNPQPFNSPMPRSLPTSCFAECPIPSQGQSLIALVKAAGCSIQCAVNMAWIMRFLCTWCLRQVSNQKENRPGSLNVPTDRPRLFLETTNLAFSLKFSAMPVVSGKFGYSALKHPNLLQS